MDIMTKMAEVVGGVMVQLRKSSAPKHQAVGATPDIPGAKKQGLMTLKMPTAKGWQKGHKPQAAAGLQVNVFAEGLAHPRWIEVLPNGDVLVAEALSEDRAPRDLFDRAMVGTMKRAAAMGKSANRISLWRDADGDGTAEIRHDFLTGQRQPFGMALVEGTFYVGNTDGIVAFPYADGADRIEGAGQRLVEF